MVSRKPKVRSGKRRRPVARELSEQADRILEDALQREREYQRLGLTSVTISRGELIRKLSGKSAHSPFLTQISRSNAVRGATFLLNFGLMNPDPFPYDELNLGLCYCWSDAGGLSDPGSTLLRADPAIGVRQVAIGTLNSSAMPYYLASLCDIPATFRTGPADVNWFLYQPDPFAPAVLLSRGTMRVVVA
ncbi:MAG: hypothetical protein QOH59_1529 [Gemmatimonadales bacterium]|nr:hypothetical protein [Gemmatimonadales bacterium]